MLKHSLIACLMVSLWLIAIPNAAVDAQTNPAQQNAFLEGIRASVVQTIGAQDKTVEMLIAGNIFVVSRANSNMNATSHGARNNEGAAIGSVVSKAIADKSEFRNIIAIRVQYLIRNQATADTKVVDTVEFRKDQNGVFQLHMT